jgi:hypothetical protein
MNRATQEGFRKKQSVHQERFYCKAAGSLVHEQEFPTRVQEHERPGAALQEHFIAGQGAGVGAGQGNCADFKREALSKSPGLDET